MGINFFGERFKVQLIEGFSVSCCWQVSGHNHLAEFTEIPDQMPREERKVET